MKKIFSKLTKKHLVVVSVVLMVALVVGMGAMTYAKYVSSYDAGTYTATAAKWGFVVTADAANLFGEQYKRDASTGADAYATINEEGNVVVKGSANAKLVAPGTMGYLNIALSGQAEVAAQLKINLNVTQTIGDGSYNPIEWALASGTDVPTTGWTTDPTTLSSTTQTYTPTGEDVSGTYRLYWRWAFSTNEDNDKKDTVIGAKAAKPETTLEDIKKITGLTTLTEAQYSAYKTTLAFTVTVVIEQTQ